MANLNKVLMTVLKQLTDMGVQITNRATVGVEIEDGCILRFYSYSTDRDLYLGENLIVAESPEELEYILQDGRRYSRRIKKVLMDMFQIGDFCWFSESNADPADYKPELREFCEVRDEYEALRNEVSKIDFNPWHKAMGHGMVENIFGELRYDYSVHHPLKTYLHYSDIVSEYPTDKTHLQLCLTGVEYVREVAEDLRKDLEAFHEACKNPDFWANGGSLLEG